MYYNRRIFQWGFLCRAELRPGGREIELQRGIRERAAVLFAALGHTARLRIVELLVERERTVNEIATALDLHQSNTSQHLAILTRAGILAVKPQGSARYYRLRGPRVECIISLIEEFCAVHSLYGGTDEEAQELG